VKGEMKPTHDLGLVKGLMKDGSWNVTVSALDTAVELGFDEEDDTTVSSIILKKRISTRRWNLKRSRG
jgi:hypothetical protein